MVKAKIPHQKGSFNKIQKKLSLTALIEPSPKYIKDHPNRLVSRYRRIRGVINQCLEYSKEHNILYDNEKLYDYIMNIQIPCIIIRNSYNIR